MSLIVTIRTSRGFPHAYQPPVKVCLWGRCTICGQSIARSHMFQTSNLKTGRDTTKRHSVKSIDRANIFVTHFSLFCCIYFGSQVMKIWKKKEGAVSLPLVVLYTYSTKSFESSRALESPHRNRNAWDGHFIR